MLVCTKVSYWRSIMKLLRWTLCRRRCSRRIFSAVIKKYRPYLGGSNAVELCHSNLWHANGGIYVFVYVGHVFGGLFGNYSLANAHGIQDA